MNGDGGLERIEENRSLTERAREALLRAIREGGFPDGRLAPEAQLAEQLGVSRTTLRAALQSLADDGLISRRRRHGTVVNRHMLQAPSRLNRLVPFTTMIEESGYGAAADPQEHEIVTSFPPELGEALGLASGTECLQVRRLLRADGEPAIAAVDLIPLARLRSPLGKVAEAETTVAFLAAHGAPPVEYATAEIVPRAATATEPGGLGLEPGTAYVELVETIFSYEHDPIAISRVSVDSRRVRFSLLRR